MNDLKCIDTRDLAKLTGLGYQSIRNAISEKSGSRKLSLPRITRVGARVFFRLDHVREWLDEQAKISAPQPTASNDLPISAHAARRGRPRNAIKNSVEVL